MARMTEKDIRESTSPYYILRLDEIPTEVSFYQLLEKVATLSRHVIGIARTANYRVHRLGRTIYLYCTSIIDARFLEQCYIDYVNDGRDGQACTLVDSIVGRASLMNASYTQRPDKIPHTVFVKGLERQPDSRGATYYLMEVAAHFETRGALTAIRLNYDVRRASTRNDAFVTYLHLHEAEDMGGKSDPIIHLMFNREISAVISDNVPMLVRIPDSGILVNGHCVWTNTAERVNQLIISHDVNSRQIPEDRSLEPVHEQQEAQVEDIPGPSVRSIIVRPPTSKVTAPASRPVISKKMVASALAKVSNKSRSKKRDESSKKHKQKEKSATDKEDIELVYNSSEDEIVMRKKSKRRVVYLSNQIQVITSPDNQVTTKQVSNENHDDDDERLIINEDVDLHEEEEESSK